jgi:phosphoserine aminotransferase
LDLAPEQVKKIVQLLDVEGVAYDCGAYKDALPGLRFWCGATIEHSDIQKMLPWLEWAYAQVR